MVAQKCPVCNDNLEITKKSFLKDKFGVDKQPGVWYSDGVLKDTKPFRGVVFPSAEQGIRVRGLFFYRKSVLKDTKKGGREMDDEWDKQMPACRYNDGCWCLEPVCHNCGWNPAVARKRTLEWIKAAGHARG